MANYHTWLNNKLDGKLETIQKFRDVYFLPVFKKCFEIAGCNVDEIEFLNADELYYDRRNGHNFWDYFMKVAKNLTLSRVVKSVTVTGKQAGDGVEFGTLCYPAMQVADPFFLQSHIVHAGIDQRKCHVLMREVAPNMNEGFELKIGESKVKPIAVHHHLLLSLGVSAQDTQKRMEAGAVSEELKMSKSKPDSAVWVSDNLEEISRKLKKAYCPIPQENQTIDEIRAIQEFNPVLNWCKYLLFPSDKILEVQRPEKFGGNKVYQSYTDLENDYFTLKLHPLDLKNALANSLATWLLPIHEYVLEHNEGLNILEKIGKK
jgi:tyrosyl-tRNA synthetase